VQVQVRLAKSCESGDERRDPIVIILSRRWSTHSG